MPGPPRAPRPTPRAPGRRFGGKTAPVADSEAEPGAAGDLVLGARAAEGVWGFALEVEAEESGSGIQRRP